MPPVCGLTNLTGFPARWRSACLRLFDCAQGRPERRRRTRGGKDVEESGERPSRGRSPGLISLRDASPANASVKEELSGLLRLQRRPEERGEEPSVWFPSKHQLRACGRHVVGGDGDEEGQRSAGNAAHFRWNSRLSIVEVVDLGHVVSRHCKDMAARKRENA
jgi:hypothetical protein